MHHRLRSAASLAVSLALTTSSSIATASSSPPPAPDPAVHEQHEVDATVPIAKRPTKAEHRAFERAHAEMNEAVDAGDWESFLEKAQAALSALPEHPSSQGDRGDVVAYVGELDVDQRSPQQIRRSIEILEEYVEQLRAAYGAEAGGHAQHQKAKAYIRDLRSRLAETEPVSPRVADPIATKPADLSQPADAGDRPHRRNNAPLVVSGAVLTGIGGAVLIAGIAFYGVRARAYNDLSADYDANPASVTPDQEDEALRKTRPPFALIVPGAVILATGIGLLVAGLVKRNRGRARTSAHAAGMQIRF